MEVLVTRGRGRRRRGGEPGESQSGATKSNGHQQPFRDHGWIRPRGMRPSRHHGSLTSRMRMGCRERKCGAGEEEAVAGEEQKGARQRKVGDEERERTIWKKREKTRRNSMGDGM